MNTMVEICNFAKHVHARLVEPGDAEFIVAVRSHHRNASRLNSSAASIDEQRRWIEAYKAREKAGTEYYYLVLTSRSQPCGVFRFADITPESLVLGSWVMDPAAPPQCAIGTCVVALETVFTGFGCRQVYLDVRHDNVSGTRFHKRNGAVPIAEKGDRTMFAYTSEAHISLFRPHYRRYYTRAAAETLGLASHA